MAYGLGLIYGVLRVVNLAHAGVIMAAAYLTWFLHSRFGVDPYLSIPVVLIVVFAIALVTLVGLHLFLTRTYTGKAIRAVAQNPDSCTILGIDADRFYTLTFGIGTALGGLAGLLLSTVFAFNPASGAVELLKSFVVVVLGGLGSVLGIAAGALVLAFAESYSILVMPSYLTSAVGFVLLVIVLILRPGGLFGQRVLA